MRLMLAALCAVTALCLLPMEDAPDAGAPAGDAAACKPLAPIEVALSTPDGEGPGLVRVVMEIVPHLDFEAIAWHWERTPDVRLASGPGDGVADPARGARSGGEISLLVPDDGRRHRAELVVVGRRRGPVGASTDAAADAAVDAEPEFVTTVRALTWGAPPDPAPTVWSTDATTGAAAPCLAVPARHVPAAVTPAPSAPGGRR